MHCNEEDYAGQDMSKRLVERLCRETGQTSSGALYLQGCRWNNIQGLDSFKSVRLLHLENNCLASCEGLGHLTLLRTLYLQQNQLCSLKGLADCTALITLDVSSNPLGKLELGCLPASLLTLHAASTGISNVTDVQVLAADCPSLQVLDVQHNPGLADDQALLPALCTLTGLRVLYTQGCPLSSRSNYRRVLVSGLSSLHYLDDRPVDEVERAGALAWLAGGRDAERAARLAWREEHRRQQRRTTVTFAVERAKRRVLHALGPEALVGEPLMQDTHSLVSRLVDEQFWEVMAPVPVDLSCSADLISTSTSGGADTQTDQDWWGHTLELLPHAAQHQLADTATDWGSSVESDAAQAPSGAAVTTLPQVRAACDLPDRQQQQQQQDETRQHQEQSVIRLGAEALQWVSQLRGILREFQLTQHAEHEAALPTPSSACTQHACADPPDNRLDAVDTAQLCTAGLPAPAARACSEDDLSRRSDAPGVSLECAVCAEEVVPGQLAAVLPCSHAFHSKCIKQWVLTWLCGPHAAPGSRPAGPISVTCPMCRTPLALPPPPRQLLSQLPTRRLAAVPVSSTTPRAQPLSNTEHAIEAVHPTASLASSLDNTATEMTQPALGTIPISPSTHTTHSVGVLPQQQQHARAVSLPAKTTTAGIIMQMLGSDGVHVLPRRPLPRASDAHSALRPSATIATSTGEAGGELGAVVSTSRAAGAGPAPLQRRACGYGADLALWNMIKQERQQSKAHRGVAHQQHVISTGSVPPRPPGVAAESIHGSPAAEQVCGGDGQGMRSDEAAAVAVDQPQPPATTLVRSSLPQVDAGPAVLMEPQSTTSAATASSRSSFLHSAAALAPHIPASSVQAVLQAVASARLSTSCTRRHAVPDPGAVGQTRQGGSKPTALSTTLPINRLSLQPAKPRQPGMDADSQEADQNSDVEQPPDATPFSSKADAGKGGAAYGTVMSGPKQAGGGGGWLVPAAGTEQPDEDDLYEEVSFSVNSLPYL